jgi:hypothetical protein
MEATQTKQLNPKEIKHELNTAITYLKVLEAGAEKLSEQEKAYLAGVKRILSGLVEKLNVPKVGVTSNLKVNL